MPLEGLLPGGDGDEHLPEPPPEIDAVSRRHDDDVPSPDRVLDAADDETSLPLEDIVDERTLLVTELLGMAGFRLLIHHAGRGPLCRPGIDAHSHAVLLKFDRILAPDDRRVHARRFVPRNYEGDVRGGFNGPPGEYPVESRTAGRSKSSEAMNVSTAAARESGESRENGIASCLIRSSSVACILSRRWFHR